MAAFSRGRAAFQILSTVGLPSAYLVVQTAFLDQYVGYKQNRSRKNLSGKLIPGFIGDSPRIGDELQKLIDEVLLESVGKGAEQGGSVRFDAWFRSEPWFAGSALLKTGAHILLPDFLNVTEHKQLNASTCNEMLLAECRFKIEDKSVWLSKDGIGLIDSLVLSPKAKKFLIARELHHVQTEEVTQKAVCMMLGVAFYHFFLNYAVYKTPSNVNVAKHVRNSRLVSLIVIGVLGAMTNMILNLYYEANADASAVTRGLKMATEISKNGDDPSVDEDYLEGAIEYYSKVIQRNKAIKSIVQGDSWYSRKASHLRSDGSFKASLIRPHSCPVERLKSVEHWKSGDKTREKLFF